MGRRALPFQPGTFYSVLIIPGAPKRRCGIGDQVPKTDPSGSRREGVWSICNAGICETIQWRMPLSDRIASVNQDQKGGIWAGTSAGIDRLARDRFVPVAVPAM